MKDLLRLKNISHCDNQSYSRNVHLINPYSSESASSLISTTTGFYGTSFYCKLAFMSVIGVVRSGGLVKGCASLMVYLGRTIAFSNSFILTRAPSFLNDEETLDKC